MWRSLFGNLLLLQVITESPTRLIGPSRLFVTNGASKPPRPPSGLWIILQLKRDVRIFLRGHHVIRQGHDFWRLLILRVASGFTSFLRLGLAQCWITTN